MRGQVQTFLRSPFAVYLRVVVLQQFTIPTLSRPHAGPSRDSQALLHVEDGKMLLKRAHREGRTSPSEQG